MFSLMILMRAALGHRIARLFFTIATNNTMDNTITISATIQRAAVDLRRASS